MGSTSIKFLDAANKTSAAGFYTPDMTAGNIAATNTAIDTLKAAMLAVTLGNVVRDARYAQVTDNAAVIPSDEAARRQNKWAVSAVDNVLSGEVSFTIPTADLQFCATGSNAMDTATQEYIDLKAAIEAVVQSKYGNAITVTKIEFVGRSI